MTRTLLLLFLAGGLGTLARFGFTRWVAAVAGTGFPWGTLAVNCVGSLLCGVVWGVLQALELTNNELRTLLLVGFFGALTTFSALALDAALLANDARLASAIGYVMASNVGGLVCLAFGIVLARNLPIA